MQKDKKSINIVFILKIALFCAFLSLPKFSISLNSFEDFLSSHKKSEIHSAVLKVGGSQEYNGLKKVFSHSSDALYNEAIITFFGPILDNPRFSFSSSSFFQTNKSISARGPPRHS